MTCLIDYFFDIILTISSDRILDKIKKTMNSS